MKSVFTNIRKDNPGKKLKRTCPAISKTNPKVLLGVKEHIFHCVVPPIPTSVSETVEFLALAEQQEPRIPSTLSPFPSLI